MRTTRRCNGRARVMRKADEPSRRAIRRRICRNPTRKEFPDARQAGRKRGIASSSLMSSQTSSTGIPIRISSGSRRRDSRSSARRPRPRARSPRSRSAAADPPRSGDARSCRCRALRGPRPAATTASAERHSGQIGDGGSRVCPHAAQRCTTSRCSAAACHHGSVVASATGDGIVSGKNRSLIAAPASRRSTERTPHS